MTKETIKQQVNAIIAEEFEVPESLLTPDANVKQTLQLDSLNLVDLIALVQQHYRVSIPVADLPLITTFDSLYDYILEHQP